jgi:hypothetical protein
VLLLAHAQGGRRQCCGRRWQVTGVAATTAM